jgi:GNAT superfamily N-acetyltransferase
MPSLEPICIRLATLADAPGIASLSAQLGYPADPAEVLPFQSLILQDPDHVVFVAESLTGAVCGWVHVFLSRRLFMPPFAELGGIVVDEASQRLGIGRALLRRAEAWAAQSGCAFLRIRSNTLRLGAHEFYQRMGYTASKSQRVYDKELPG